MKKVEIKNYSWNRYRLYVNWYCLWDYIYWKEKKHLNPEKRAKEQVKKRNVVIDRNIARLKEELSNREIEKKVINS